MRRSEKDYEIFTCGEAYHILETYDLLDDANVLHKTL